MSEQKAPKQNWYVESLLKYIQGLSFILFSITNEYLSSWDHFTSYSMMHVQGTLHVKWAMEKSSLETARVEAEKKVKELDEQVIKKLCILDHV